jgi:hypothetical protein
MISRAQQPTGAGPMKNGKKMIKYQEGGMMPKRPPISQEDIDRMMMEGESEYQSTMSSEDREKRQKTVKEEDMKKKMPSKKPKMMMGGGMAKGYKAGGKVRGAGCAKKGVRPCRMM